MYKRQVLKRQARQANRFKILSAEVRQAEATLLHLRWSLAKAQEGEAESALAQATSQVAELAQAQMEAAKNQAIAAHKLPELREAEAAAAASASRNSGNLCAAMAWFLAASICAWASSATCDVAWASALSASPSWALASDQRRCSSVASACRTSADRILKRLACRAWRLRTCLLYTSPSPRD